MDPPMEDMVFPWSRSLLSPSASFPGRIGSKWTPSMPWPDCPVPLCSMSLLRPERGGDPKGFLLGLGSFLSFILLFPQEVLHVLINPPLGTGLELV